MPLLSFDNPVFAAFAISAAIMVLKSVAMSWLTVARMMQVKGGYRSPEDLRRTLLNPAPDPRQLLPDERANVSGASSRTIWRTCRSSLWPEPSMC